MSQAIGFASLNSHRSIYLSPGSGQIYPLYVAALLLYIYDIAIYRVHGLVQLVLFVFDVMLIFL